MKRDIAVIRLLLHAAILLPLIFWGCDVNSPEEETFSNDRSFMQNKLLGRGINIGNALEAPNEGEWGVTLQADYFTKIRSAGFSSVRLPIRWSAHCSGSFPYTIDQAFLNRVEWAVNQSLNSGLAVIINMHHYNDLFSFPEEEKSRFLSLWKQIGERFKNYDSRLFFEILNEPNGNLTPERWNVFLKNALDTIRVSNPERTVIIGTAEWGGFSSVSKLSLPAGDKNLIVTVHYYQPFQFTHQGAEWVEGSNAWLGTTWNGSAGELQMMESDFLQAVTWARQKNIPLNLGEFGAYNKAWMTSRVKWTAAVRQLAEKYSMSWNYWEFCAGFGIYDRTTAQFNPALLGALIPPV